MLQVIEEASQLQDLEASKSSSMFAEAMIVPLNPHKISSYITGAALESERIDGKLNWNQAADNIETAREYLATCSNGFEYNSACAEFLEETFLVQAGSDPEDIFCPAIQGARINDVAREWRQKIADRDNPNDFERRMEIEKCKKYAKEMGRDPAKVRGVGEFQQNLPPAERGNPLAGPWQNGYTPIWRRKFFRGGEILMITVRTPIWQRVAGKIISPQAARCVTRIVVIYSFARYGLHIFQCSVGTILHLYDFASLQVEKYTSNVKNITRLYKSKNKKSKIIAFFIVSKLANRVYLESD